MAKGATTSDSGIPVASDEQALTAGPDGPTPLQDAYLVQKMQYFNRDRSPSGWWTRRGEAPAASSR
jgi:catalase